MPAVCFVQAVSDSFGVINQYLLTLTATCDGHTSSTVLVAQAMDTEAHWRAKTVLHLFISAWFPYSD